MDEFKQLHDYAEEIGKLATEASQEYETNRKKQRGRILNAQGTGNPFKVYAVSYACQCGAVGTYQSSNPFMSFHCPNCSINISL